MVALTKTAASVFWALTVIRVPAILSAVSPTIEAGRLFLPVNAAWLADYEAELATFPNAAHDDQVDMTSQFLRWATARRGAGPMIRRL